MLRGWKHSWRRSSAFARISPNIVVAVNRVVNSIEPAPRMLVAQRTPVSAVGLTPVLSAGTRLAPQGSATIVDSGAQIILAPCHGRTLFCQTQARVGDRELVETAPKDPSCSRHVM